MSHKHLNKFAFEISRVKTEEITPEKGTNDDQMEIPVDHEEKENHISDIEPDTTIDKGTSGHSPADKVENDDVDVFKIYLGLLNQCETFEELHTQCKVFCLNPVVGKPRAILEENVSADNKAMDLYPSDYKRNIYPENVRADGDGLPGCGSMFLYGHDRNSEELRVRIISELALNSDYYLDEHNLRRGFSYDSEDSLKKTFAMFSPDFIPGKVLTEEIIRRIFEIETMSIARPKSFMGIWQMFGLASVLQMPIFSVYSDLGENFYRKHMHRLIVPRISTTRYPVSIMWTSTRNDMLPINWKPNHFVPVLPFEHSGTTDESNVASGNAKIEETSQTKHTLNIIKVEVITGADDIHVERTDRQENTEIIDENTYSSSEMKSNNKEDVLAMESDGMENFKSMNGDIKKGNERGRES